MKPDAGGLSSGIRVVDLVYDTESRRMSITYNPENIGHSRTCLAVEPWPGLHEFIVDESRAAGCDKWLVRVQVRWDADAALAGTRTSMEISYSLEDFDCRDLVEAARRP